jgi:hypothetical protein
MCQEKENGLQSQGARLFPYFLYLSHLRSRALGGGVTSGNNGDCEFVQYMHAPSGSGFTCEESLDITSWNGSGGTFVVSGTATVNPTSLTGPCLELFPVPAGFPVDTGIPSSPGHYNLGGIGGLRGEFQIHVTQIP